MRVLNYLAYVLSAILFPQPFIVYGLCNNYWTDKDILWAIFIAGIISFCIFMLFALLDNCLHKIQKERNRKKKREKQDKK